MKYFIGSLGIVLLSGITNCTNLDETVYDIITADAFFQTKENVYQAFVRPFEHCYAICGNANFLVAEGSTDHFMTPNREGHWLDGQNYFRLHWHEWTIDDWIPRDAWNDNFQGIVYCNSAIGDLSRLDPTKFNMTDGEINNLIGSLRALRAWLYINLLDMFRNIPIVTTFPGEDMLPRQAPPKETFSFIESELKDLLTILNAKAGQGGNGSNQGMWTKAGAAALLVRLYLNAQVWINEDRYAESADYAQRIINGEYGSYGIATRWDAPYDWNNVNCEELIYAFTSSYGYSHWVYSDRMFWVGAPRYGPLYFGFLDWGNVQNFRFALQPGLDLYGNEYAFDNGKPVRKFKKYPDDVRLTKYRNLGNTTREGMFLYGALEYVDANGTTLPLPTLNGTYGIYIRDQVGWFQDTDTSSMSPNPSGGPPVMISDMNHADENSGWFMIKYPIYRSDDAGKMESDYAVIRLAEMYYSLAECKFRQGDKATAAVLLNKVRARYYPEGSPSLYLEDGSQITEQELLDEWGREFLGERLRRTTLCRFGVYTSTEWWDKRPESDNHTMILPFHRTILQANPNLIQNPGYPDGR